MWQGLIEQMAKLRSVTEIAPKSSFLCEEQNPYLPCEPWFLQAGRYVRPGETTARRVIPTQCGVNTESVAKPSCCCCCFLSNYVVGVLFVYFDYMLEFQPVLSRISIGHAMLFPIFTCLHFNRFSKIMAQFCYWRQYLDIELIPVTDLLLWVARMDIDQNFKNLANFINCYCCTWRKITKKIIRISVKFHWVW